MIAESGPVEGELTVSNWPGYIDPGKNGSVAEFEEQTGATVKYIEDINSNLQFFGKMQPLLDQGESGGRDIIVVTDWMAKRMYDLGYLEEINPDDIQTVLDNLAPQFQSEGSYDPEHKFSIPWQGGMTGLWIIKGEADDVTSVNDLFDDPKYKGRVTVLDEMRDTVPLVMRADGVDMANATKEDWLAAIDKIGKAVDSGQIRKVTGNEYTEDLTSGNVVASVGWSGDGYLIGRDDVEWRRPDEGCNLWFDMMAIPARRAEHGRCARVHELRIRARGPGRHRGVRQLRHASRRGQGDPGQARSEARGEPADLPRRPVRRGLLPVPGAAGRRRRRPGGRGGVERRHRRRRARLTEERRGGGNNEMSCARP